MIKNLFWILLILCAGVAKAQTPINDLNTNAPKAPIKSETTSAIVNGADTVKINDHFSVVLKFPSKNVKTTSYYEGGFFVSYFCPKDTAVISIHSGGMSDRPFVSGKGFVVEDSVLIQEVAKERSGYCTSSNEKFPNKKGYFKEKEFTKLSFTAMYEWVDKSKQKRYNDILQNIQFLEK